MSALLLLSLYGIHLFPLLTAQCVYPDFDLSQLEGSNIQCPFEDSPTNILQFTPCESDLQCSMWDMDRYMVLQNSLGGSCQAGVALFDAAITPRQTTIDGQNAYVFDYANGETSFGCYNARTLDLTFICDANADPYGTTLCGEKESEICAYYLTIYTKLACGPGSDDNESSGLSTGSIVLVLLFVFIMLYCVGGYIFNGMRNPDKDWSDFEYNVPNLWFWKILPSYIFAGCTVTKEWVQTKTGKGEGADRTDSVSYDELDAK